MEIPSKKKENNNVELQDKRKECDIYDETERF